MAFHYQWRHTDDNGEAIPPRQYLPAFKTPADEGPLRRMILNGLAATVAKTVIRQLVYPGTWTNSLRATDAAVQWLHLRLPLPSHWLPPLEVGRANLISRQNGQRRRLRTRTGNIIDSMFVDRRNTARFPKGNALVITCEGNYGFYEDGSAQTPLTAGYSVLMWNHPGYGNSTGVPSPFEEGAAIDVVVQFAILDCGWNESDIVIHGWSIGGYTATWAAMNYPNIRALVLDATFDDIVPLIERWMPRYSQRLIERAVRTHLNLNIAQQLARYNGPVILIRRSEDDMMTAERDPSLETMRRTNRANYLLKGLLLDRYPNLFRDDESVGEILDEWLVATPAGQNAIRARYGVDYDEWIRVALMEYAYGIGGLNQINGNGAASVFPMLIGEDFDLESRQRMVLFLAEKYFMEVDSDHYTHMSAREFVIPGHPWE